MSLSNSSETEIEGGESGGVSSSLHSERKKPTEGKGRGGESGGEESIKDETKENRSVARGHERPPEYHGGVYASVYQDGISIPLKQR